VSTAIVAASVRGEKLRFEEEGGTLLKALDGPAEGARILGESLLVEVESGGLVPSPALRTLGGRLRRSLQARWEHPVWVGLAPVPGRLAAEGIARARTAVEVGRIVSPKPRAVVFEDVAAEAALLADRRACERLAGILDSVRAHEKRRGGALIQTLELFFRCGSVAEAARRLDTHRHTVEYRLDQVESLTGRSVRQSPGRFDVEAALVAARLLEGVPARPR